MIQSKTSTWSAIKFTKKTADLDEPTIWSCDRGQQIPCFDRCQLSITWMSNIKMFLPKKAGCTLEFHTGIIGGVDTRLYSHKMTKIKFSHTDGALKAQSSAIITQRCIQSVSLRPGSTRFPFGRIEYGTKGQLDAEKKLNVYANYERQEKHANGVFHKEIEHSHFSQRRND